jgi:hypothetical protein
MITQSVVGIDDADQIPRPSIADEYLPNDEKSSADPHLPLTWTETAEPTRASTPDSDTLADVVERLFVVYQQQLSRTTIVMVARRCRRELDIISGPALPELLERLARQRLTTLTAPKPRTTTNSNRTRPTATQPAAPRHHD